MANINNASQYSRWVLLKDVLFYAGALFLGFVALYTVVCGIFHTTIYRRWDPKPFVLQYPLDYVPAPGTPSKTRFDLFAAQGLGTPTNPIKVLLMGDSIVNNPWIQSYDLKSVMQKVILKSTNLTVHLFNEARSACLIRDIMNPTTDLSALGWIPKYHPHAVIELSNSDVSMCKSTWPKQKWNDYKSVYENDLKNMVSYLKNKVGAVNYAYGGPTVLTEGPLLYPPRMKGFAFMLKDIRNINMKVAEAYNATYLDFYTAIKSVSVPWWGLYSQYITNDGEHFNKIGVQMMADLFIQFFLAPVNVAQL